VLSPAPGAAAIRLYGAASHPLYAAGLAANRLPTTRQMADAGASLAAKVHGLSLSPDDRLYFSLAAETELFFALSDALGQRWLEEEVKKGASFATVAAYVMGTAQSSKSRRGTSLQYHFAAVLDAEEVPYTPQCVTEGKETPDFVVPGCDEYHDKRRPDEGLRMVACKSTVKERWRQVLKEADRIDEKYFLTLDPALTDDTITAMSANRLRPFLPRQVLDGRYATRATRGQLRSVAELVDALLAVV